MLRNILSTQQFLNPSLLEKIFTSAEHFEQWERSNTTPPSLRNKIIATVFYEPSTRTRFSFESAAFKLGAQVITTESAGHFSSAIKGETLEDSIRIISGYADAIVLRHPDIGSAKRAASVASVPIINAGDGSGEHPTQALLDLYTIKKELGRTDKLKIALVGDLLYGRTVHSLIQLLSMCPGVEVLLVSPSILKIPTTYKKFMKKHKINFRETSLATALPQVDVLYMTRVQKERFSNVGLYDNVKNAFVIDRAALKKLKKNAIIMHPLPRVAEINTEIDSDPRAAYFRQAQNGLYVRMAILDHVLRAT